MSARLAVLLLPLVATAPDPGPRAALVQDAGAIRSDLREADRLHRGDKDEEAAILLRKAQRAIVGLDEDRTRRDLARDVDRLLEKCDKLDRRRGRELRDAARRLVAVAKTYAQKRWFRMAERLVDLAWDLDAESTAPERRKLADTARTARGGDRLPDSAALFAADALRGEAPGWSREGAAWLTPAEAGPTRESLRLADLSVLLSEKWLSGPLRVELEGRRAGGEGPVCFGVVVGRQAEDRAILAWIGELDGRAAFVVARATPAGIEILLDIELRLRPDELAKPLRLSLTLADRAILLQAQDLAPRRIPVPDLDTAGRIGLCQLPGATARARIEDLELSRPE
ncbi:MAG: hypothetical protein R3F30_16225 [Planctomycetota bacterium]